MYNTNSSKMEYFKHRAKHEYDSYNDDFKGFSNEMKEAKDKFSSEEKKRKPLFNFLFRKASNN